MHHRQQHRQPRRLHADGQTARARALRVVDQRLDLDQQGPRSFQRDQHAAAGDRRFVLRQEQRRRIVDAAQAAVGHREYPELVHRAEPILDRADDAKAGMRIAFEIQHGVDDVLEHPRSGDRAFLGHVPDQDDGDALLFRYPRELRRAFANLRDAARRRRQRFGVDGLDRIDDDYFRLRFANGRDDRLDLDLGQHADPGILDAEALRAQRYLLGRFFAGDVEARARLADQCQRLQQQRRLADARIAAEQDHRAVDRSTAEHAVEFGDAGRMARRIGRGDRAQFEHRRAAAGQRLEAGRGRDGDAFHQSVPCAAAGALALPFRRLCAALGALINGGPRLSQAHLARHG